MVTPKNVILILLSTIRLVTLAVEFVMIVNTILLVVSVNNVNHSTTGIHTEISQMLKSVNLVIVIPPVHSEAVNVKP